MSSVEEDIIIIMSDVKKTLVLLNKIHKQTNHLRVKNNGTGAGGSNTNTNGLKYEKLTYLPKLLNVDDSKIIFGKGTTDYYHKYKQFIIVRQYGLNKFLINQFNPKSEKILKPDECIIDEDKKILYIIEKKFQQCDGSVDEKIQTALFKKWYYKKQYPIYTVEYIYVLSDWFKQNKYKPEMIFNKLNNIHVLFASDENYVTKLMDIVLK
jgi:hypothetical protein